MSEPVNEELEAQYDLTRLHPNLDEILARWSAEAAAFRADWGGELDIAYGPSVGQRIDTFAPTNAARGAIIFLTGGYWILDQRSTQSHFARGPLAHNLAVAVAGYDVAPGVDLTAMVAQARAAVAFVADRLSMPVAVVGHSSGGHLAAMALADIDTPVRHGVAVSGLFDLEPFLQLRLNKLLQLDEATAVELSPIHLEPPTGTSLRLVIGAVESAGFRGQSLDLAARWAGWGVAASYSELQADHFSVVEQLADPTSELTRLVVAAAEEARAA